MVQRFLLPWKCIYNKLIAFFFPNLCIGCESRIADPLASVCEGCYSLLERIDSDRLNDLSFFISVQPNAIDSFYSVFRYNGLVRTLIHELKYNETTKLATFFANELAFSIPQSRFQNIQAIVPIPMHPVKQRQRGYNQTILLAKALAPLIAIPLETRLLKKTRNTDSQTTKTTIERQENQEHAFAIFHGAVIPDSVLLVDDVLTTGSTINEAAKVLKKAGVRRIVVLTIAFAHKIEGVGGEPTPSGFWEQL